MHTEYKVKLEVFEGPLDLLLYLIRKDEVDIYDVSIERVTSQYLEYLETFRMLDLDIAGEIGGLIADLPDSSVSGRPLLERLPDLIELQSERCSALRQIVVQLPGDPGALLLLPSTNFRVTPESAEFWEGSGKVVIAVKLIAAIASGQRMDHLGENEKVGFPHGGKLAG